MVRAAKTRSPRGRTAVAEFKTRLAQGDLALVRCLPHTGRTHQLRVQLSALGHPILGDDRYGNREFNRAYGAPVSSPLGRYPNPSRLERETHCVAFQALFSP